MSIDIIADAREWLATQGDRIQTHSDTCHLLHPVCLVSRLVQELSRSGQSEAKTRDFDADCPARDNAAPAAIACGSDRNDKPAPRPAGTGDTPETAAFWAVIMDGEQADNEWTYRTREAADEAAAYILNHAPDAPVRVVPLVLLTAEEREAIRFAAVLYERGCRPADAATLRALLDRTSDGGNRQ